MGRKQTSNKERIMVTIDKDILEKLKELDISRSVLLTDAAKKLIQELELEEKNEKNEEF
ncbi:type II toxin-antitoxin system CcdA family antitoxin [Viridibacillus arvi]|uniref:type II toxin-antitoxin system CcdA family antitoxin n=1 Tax=Viridibacillus arvi TaxID=263475 RepID=UPI003CFD5801